MLRKHSNIKTLTLIFIEKIHYFSYIMMINLIKALLYFLASFYYFFINNFIDGFSLIILLLFFEILIL